MSVRLAVSPVTRFDASDTNATTFPFPLIDGFRLPALAGKSIPTIVATLSLITSPVP